MLLFPTHSYGRLLGPFTATVLPLCHLLVSHAYISFFQVMHSKMLRSFCVGSFKLDVWTVYKEPGD